MPSTVSDPGDYTELLDRLVSNPELCVNAWVSTTGNSPGSDLLHLLWLNDSWQFMPGLWESPDSWSG